MKHKNHSFGRKVISVAASAAMVMAFSVVAPAGAVAATTAVGKTVVTLQSTAAGKVVVTLKKITNAKGYSLKIADNANFKNAQTKTTTKTSITLTGQTQGSVEYVKARAFKKVNGKKVYGSWSAVKSVKVAGINTDNACYGQDTVTSTLEEANTYNLIDSSVDDGTTTSSVSVSRKNVTYMQATEYGTDTDLKIELLTPSTAKAGETPMLVWINGGGFTSSDPSNNLDTRLYFAEQGYVVASVQHRVSASNATFPTGIQDIKAAIRYLKAHNTTYKFNKNQVAVGGNSSGGYFATMVGVTSNTETIEFNGKQVQLDVGENLDESSAVNAVLDFYGVSDLTIIGSGLDSTLESSHHSAATTEAILLNGAAAAQKGVGVFDESMESKVASASPFTYIDSNDPPVYMVQGTKDTLVSPVATKMLQKRLNDAGIATQRTVINNGGHGGTYFVQDSILGQATSWLDTYATQDIVESEGTIDTAKGTKAYAAADLPTMAESIEGAIDVAVDPDKYLLNCANEVTYKTVKTNGTYKNLKMHIIYPSETAKGPRPVVYMAACGGFNKSDINQAYSQYLRYAKMGYVVAVAEIRVVPAATMPAPLQDAKAGIRWLRAHASDYNIDTDCFITIGTSAGGYYAAMLGPTGNTTQYSDSIKFDVGDNLEYSSAVQGVVDLYGVSDLTIIGAGLSNYDVHNSESNTEALVVNGTAFGTNPGGSVFSDMAKTAIYSPFTYLDSDDPMYLFFHGTADTIVSPLATMEYYNKCKAAGLDAERYAFAGAGHGGKQMTTDYAYSLIDNFMAKVVASCK